MDSIYTTIDIEIAHETFTLDVDYEVYHDEVGILDVNEDFLHYNFLPVESEVLRNSFYRLHYKKIARELGREIMDQEHYNKYTKKRKRLAKVIDYCGISGDYPDDILD